jgi:hypothetical protein
MYRSIVLVFVSGGSRLYYYGGSIVMALGRKLSGHDEVDMHVGKYQVLLWSM